MGYVFRVVVVCLDLIKDNPGTPDLASKWSNGLFLSSNGLVGQWASRMGKGIFVRWWEIPRKADRPSAGGGLRGLIIY